MDDEADKRGTRRRLEWVSVAAFGLTMGCLFIGQTAEQFASQVEPSPTAVAAAKPRFNAIDYAQTGAVNGATVIIGPCGSGGR